MTKPFDFTLLPLGNGIPCSFNCGYEAEAKVPLTKQVVFLYVCHICLPRARATLKMVEKAFPKRKKQVRP